MATLATFWSLPPIQDSIASNLKRIDLWNCIQVSHAFHQLFIPFLWRHITHLGSKSLSLFLTSSAQPVFRNHVRSLKILGRERGQDLKDNFESYGPFPNLVSFQCPGIYAPRVMDLLSFAAHHKKLQWLSLALQDSTPSLLCDLGSLLGQQAPSGMRVLHLHLTGSFHSRDLAVLLSKASGLEDLVLGCDKEFRLVNTYMDDVVFERTSVRRLHWKLPGVTLNMLVVRFLAFCPMLEDLKLVIDLDRPLVANTLANVLGTRCPHLKILDLPSSVEGPDGIAGILRVCPSLSTLQFSMPSECGPVVEAICTRHGKTLERLVALRRYRLKMEELFGIMNSCSLLQHLTINVQWSQDPVQSTAEVLAKLKKLPWRCMGLSSLELYFGAQLNMGSLEVLSLFYEQLGRMKNLRYLTLNEQYPENKAFSESFLSWLHRLTGLKDLQMLYVSNDVTCLATVEHEKEMARMWPKLTRINGQAPRR